MFSVCSQGHGRGGITPSPVTGPVCGGVPLDMTWTPPPARQDGGTGYAAGGTLIAVTQEDFLVSNSFGKVLDYCTR